MGEDRRDRFGHAPDGVRGVAGAFRLSLWARSEGCFRNGDWVEVTDPNSNTKGWIQAHALAPSSGPVPYDQAGAYAEEELRQERRRPKRRGGFADMINRAFGN